MRPLGVPQGSPMAHSSTDLIVAGNGSCGDEAERDRIAQFLLESSP